ncbi:FecR domain-containing protein [Roseibacillus persicicus]|uniref:FecR protein domain-containing protein n=1 Tax=Roseibacillus persicicus TaxID=454148 RepID=A0A918TM81_9BACT|nr:FecR family protein [Roseibacillus persicicus]GHC54024.1 hypothetical protein GCM10007100_20420 [Roseibacillus persicicus]
MKRTELEALIAKSLEDSLSDGEKETLAELLREDDEALELFTDTLGTQVLLENWQEESKVVSFPKKRWRPLALAIAAGLVLAVVWQTLLTNKPEESIAKTSSLPVTLVAAEMRSIEMPSGVLVEVQGPAEYEITGDNEMILASGRLTADVPPEATGFRVMTPNGDVIDHGTRIGVAVGERQTELHVFEGKAEVLLPAEEVSAMVGVGEAVRVNHPDNAGYEPIPLSMASFGWHTMPSNERIEFDFEPGSPEWQITMQGSESDRGDRPATELTAGLARFALVEGQVGFPTAPDQVGGFHAAYRFPPHRGQGRIMPLPFHWRDSMESLCLSSPPFHLDRKGGSLTAYLTGGRGHAENPGLSREALPKDSSGEGFLGLVLRRVSDGRYLCSVRRPAGNFYEWSQVEISQRELAEATAQDSPEEIYVLDLVDTYRDPSWSWIGLDSVSVPGRLASSQN